MQNDETTPKYVRYGEHKYARNEKYKNKANSKSPRKQTRLRQVTFESGTESK
jgi:hypothetical protein